MVDTHLAHLGPQRSLNITSGSTQQLPDLTHLMRLHLHL